MIDVQTQPDDRRIYLEKLALEVELGSELARQVIEIWDRHARYVREVENIIKQKANGRKDFIDRCKAAVDGHRAITELNARNVLELWSPSPGQLAASH